MRIAQLNAENLFIAESTPEETISWPGKKPHFKLKALASTIQDIDPDILMLNEVGGPDSLEKFSSHFLGNRYQALLVEGNSERGIDIGYLIKNDFPYTCELHSHRGRAINFLYARDVEYNKKWAATHPEKRIHSQYFSRDVAELRVFNGKNLQFVILLVHLKAKRDPEGIDPEGRARRTAEVETLVELYNEIRAEKVPVIVAGDFNGSAQQAHCDPEFEALYRNTDLKDVFDILDRPSQQRTSQVQFNTKGEPFNMQIDYIFLPPELHDKIDPEQTFVDSYKDNKGYPLNLPKTAKDKANLPSDHYPLVLTLNSL